MHSSIHAQVHFFFKMKTLLTDGSFNLKRRMYNSTYREAHPRRDKALFFGWKEDCWETRRNALQPMSLVLGCSGPGWDHIFPVAGGSLSCFLLDGVSHYLLSGNRFFASLWMEFLCYTLSLSILFCFWGISHLILLLSFLVGFKKEVEMNGGLFHQKPTHRLLMWICRYADIWISYSGAWGENLPTSTS